jgi:outer membrane receptor protein involved in Fe transport
MLDLGSLWREIEDPGPLLDEMLAASRTSSDPLFRFDETSDRRHRMGIEASHDLGRSGALSGSVSAELQRLGAVRTIALAPGFGDTKDRDLRHHRLGGAVQWQAPAGTLPAGGTAIIGGELSRSALTSHYYQVATGTREDYTALDGSRGDLDARGTGNRVMGAVFAQYATPLAGPVRLSLGLRFDWLRDEFTSHPPGEPERRTASHTSLSPKVGLNVRYLDGQHQSGHLFLAASRSFKAPTPDQLFDQRTVPVPFPPFAITTSNPGLDPQHGTSLEGGVYHGVAVSPAARLDASVSVYTMAMRDELDFDVATLRYLNIGRSRHRGIEAGLTLSAGSTALFGNYTHQSAQSRTGATAGRQLKSVPRHTVHAGVSLVPVQALQVGLTVSSVHGVHLDDANAVPLQGRTIVDGRAGYRIGAVELLVDIRNLFAARYASGGYLDPSGSGAVYSYPAAGRTLALGLRSGW